MSLLPEITIYHNGECSKSKGALELLIEQNIAYNVRWYLTEPLSQDELVVLLRKLNMKAYDLVRKGEPLFQEKYTGRDITEEEWLSILIENPALIERPIVENNEKAVIARPAERVFELIRNLK